MAELPLISTMAGIQTLHRLAAELSVPPEALIDLLRAADAHSGKLRRKGLFQAFDGILDLAVR